VITNLRQSPEWIYTHVYCARGDSENRLKELTLALAFGRTSCTRFWANQLRITLTAAAFVLWQELQLRADRTALRGAQVPRLRQASSPSASTSSARSAGSSCISRNPILTPPPGHASRAGLGQRPPNTRRFRQPPRVLPPEVSSPPPFRPMNRTGCLDHRPFAVSR
jgi:hypothetical protein